MIHCIGRFRRAGCGLAFVLVTVSWLYAHAILLDANPAAKSTVKGPDIDIRLRFNSRVDGPRSRIRLVLQDKSIRDLATDKQEKPEVLSAKARGLASGAYRLQWQVLASDGHITRGEYSFQVK